jgi:hypothetical protein
VCCTPASERDRDDANGPSAAVVCGGVDGSASRLKSLWKIDDTKSV